MLTEINPNNIEDPEQELEVIEAQQLNASVVWYATASVHGRPLEGRQQAVHSL